MRSSAHSPPAPAKKPVAALLRPPAKVAHVA